MTPRRLVILLAAVAGGLPAGAAACPLCPAVSQTFSEEINASAVAVVARLVKLPPPPPAGGALDPTLPPAKAQFELVSVLKGQDVAGSLQKFEAVYFGEGPVGGRFLLMGIDPPQISWSAPVAINERIEDYLTKALALPKEGPERMRFFLDFFEDRDEMLARDVYDEFARAPRAQGT
jgi:hypothetical protein